MAIEVAYRISSWDTPLRVNPNRTAGRFNHAGSPPTQYFGLHPLTPWAEYLRFHALRDLEGLSARRLRIWALRVELADALEIGFGDAAGFGLEPENLVSADHGPCRRLGEQLRTDPSGRDTIVVPSAALPGTRNVVSFGQRAPLPYDVQPIDRIDVPCCAIAERSQPPDGIASLVRYGDDPHHALEAWAAGHRYQFRDLAPR